jgi:hypothetical protein
MIDTSKVTKITDELFSRKVVNFILAPRFCNLHMDEFLQSKEIKQMDQNKIGVVELAGICSKCAKGGIVYYLDEK